MPQSAQSGDKTTNNGAQANQPQPQVEQTEAVISQQFPEETGGVPTGLKNIDPQEQALLEDEVISWTASEYIAHEKSASWYGGLVLGATALSALLYLITRDWVSVGVVAFGTLMLAVYGAHKPRQLAYQIDPSGISVGKRHFDFDQFRTFSVVPEDEGNFASIMLMPLRRFAPPLSIYYAPKDEERILTVLSDRLPFENKGLDMTDRLMRKIRF